MTHGPTAASRNDPEALLDELAGLIANSPHNLVARGDRGKIRDVHIRECIAVADLLTLAPGGRWLDLGTGGGLPGLALAVLSPTTTWTLLDATGKKIRAVRSFITALGLPNAEAVHGRAEDVGWEPAYFAGFDGVVSRAVARLPLLLELSRPFLRDDGCFAAIKGPHVDEEIREAERTRRRLRMGVVQRHAVVGTERRTTLVTMRAEGPPPRRRSRRPGMPAAVPRGGRPR